MVKALLILGADHTLKDEEERTALDLAKLKPGGLIMNEVREVLTLFDQDPRGKPFVFNILQHTPKHPVHWLGKC